jgi:hypothetical protein
MQSSAILNFTSYKYKGLTANAMRFGKKDIALAGVNFGIANEDFRQRQKGE